MSLDAFFETHAINLEAWTSPLVRGPPDLRRGRAAPPPRRPPKHYSWLPTLFLRRPTVTDRHEDEVQSDGALWSSKWTETTSVCPRGVACVCVAGLYQPQWNGKLMNAKFGDSWEEVETWIRWAKMARIEPRMPKIPIVRLTDSRCGPPG